MYKTVILICSDVEWSATKVILAPESLFKSTFGEYFEHEKKLIFQTGWTKTSVAAATQYVIDIYEPQQLINLGTCGGFADYVEVGDILLVTKTVIYDLYELMGNPDEVIDKFSTNIDISNVSLKILDKTIPAVITSADSDVQENQVELLHQKFGAIAADWESGSIAYIATLNKKSFLILRGVSDIVSSEEAEVYGNENLFAKRTYKIMRLLLNLVQNEAK